MLVIAHMLFTLILLDLLCSRCSGFLQFYTTFSGFELGRRSQGQRKETVTSFIFQSVRMKCDVVLKHFKLNIMIQLLIELFCFRSEEVTAA